MEEFTNDTIIQLQQQDLVPNIVEYLMLLLMAYPFVTCLLWSCSGLYYTITRDRGHHNRKSDDALPSYSVIIPFHAEPDAALNTMCSLARVSPAPLEIIIVDDGSPKSIPMSMPLPPSVRIVRLANNQGKAGALQYVLPSVTSELLVCMDADTQSDSYDWTPMLANFSDPTLAAVTGKIRPVGGGGLVEWFQALDYLTVIAVIKAAESSWGGLLTVSGAFTAYRTSALLSVGGWNKDSSTEDIDASWRLQTSGWRLAFEGDWVARVEMAPNLSALWQQRRRWSAGLGRALRDYGATSLIQGSKQMPIIVLTVASLVWMASLLAMSGYCLWVWQESTQPIWRFDDLLLLTFSAAGVIAFYGQLATAMALDGRHPLEHWRSILIAPVYPVYFWVLLFSSFMAGFPKGFLRLDNGKWKRTQRRHEVRVTT